ncbi:MAG: ABC transporter permease [Phycisphaeraceae bacterium]|nr:ABC transporter permease [Phycisphaeraceae bacterium]
MLGLGATRDNPFTRSIPGLIGAGFLILMFAVCVLTLPWTLGGVRDDGAIVPRYNAGSINDARLPPFWAPGALAPGDSAPRAGEAQAPHFFLGSDAIGRSLLVRVLAGGGVSLTIGIAAALLSVFIGTLYGAISGYAGGRLDALLMRIVDVLYGLPYVLLVVLLAVAADAVVGEYVSRERERAAWIESKVATTLAAESKPSDKQAVRRELEADGELKRRLEDEALHAVPPREISQTGRTTLDLAVLFIAIGGFSWLTMARVIRGQVMSLKNQPFVEAARAIGASRRRILFVHLLPNLMAPIIVYATLTVPQAILQESFLSFLGIGVKPPLPSWGNLAAEGLPELNPYRSNWWLLLFPCLLLGLTLLALNFVGEGLREALDPRRQRR